MRQRAPTVLSAAALTVAVLGATPVGEAALEQVVPRASVGTLQLRNNAVTSAKVRNRSLLAVDFRRGQLPKGDTGERGETGPRGPSDAFAMRGPGGSLTTTSSVLARITLPAGNYVFSTNVLLQNPSAASAVAVRCVINLPGALFGRAVTLDHHGGAASTLHTIVVWDELPTGGDATLTCVVQPQSPYLGTQATATSPSIAAIRVETLTQG